VWYKCLIPGSSVNEVTDYRDSTLATDIAHTHTHTHTHTPALEHVKASVPCNPDPVSRDTEVERIVSFR
jgi:hypothetical protein